MGGIGSFSVLRSNKKQTYSQRVAEKSLHGDEESGSILEERFGDTDSLRTAYFLSQLLKSRL